MFYLFALVRCFLGDFFRLTGATARRASTNLSILGARATCKLQGARETFGVVKMRLSICNYFYVLSASDLT